MWHANLVWYLYWIFNDRLTLPLKVPIVEWKHASQHLVHYDSYSPVVSCLVVRFFFEELRRYVCWCTDDIVCTFVMLKHSSQAEIYNLEVAVFVNQQVL